MDDAGPWQQFGLFFLTGRFVVDQLMKFEHGHVARHLTSLGDDVISCCSHMNGAHKIGHFDL